MFFISASHANFTLSVKSIIDFNMPGFPLYRFKVVKYIVILANILIFCRFIVYSLKKSFAADGFSIRPPQSNVFYKRHNAA